MAWNRTVELSIGAAGEGLLISDLHIDFDIQKSLTFEENTAEFKIYNAKEDTRENIITSGNTVIFKAGYEDQGDGTLFIGQITSSISELQGSDWVTSFSAISRASKNTAFDIVMVSLSYARDSLMSDILDEIASALDLVLYGEENAEFSIPGGFIFAGSARGALLQCKDILKSNGYGLVIDNEELIVFSLTEASTRYDVVSLSYTSGLLKAWKIEEKEGEKEDDKKGKSRIGFQCLLNPEIQVNGVVSISSEKINGEYIVDRLRTFGNNYGGDFFMEGEASE